MRVGEYFHLDPVLPLSAYCAAWAGAESQCQSGQQPPPGPRGDASILCLRRLMSVVTGAHHVYCQCLLHHYLCLYNPPQKYQIWSICYEMAFLWPKLMLQFPPKMFELSYFFLITENNGQAQAQASVTSWPCLTWEVTPGQFCQFKKCWSSFSQLYTHTWEDGKCGSRGERAWLLDISDELTSSVGRRRRQLCETSIPLYWL